MRPRLRPERRAQGEGRVRALQLHGLWWAQRRARDPREHRGLMPDPKRVRAEANALVQELLTRLDASDVRELSVTRGTLRVRVSKDAAVAAPAPVAQTAPAAQAPAGAAATRPSVIPAPSAVTPDASPAPPPGLFYR